MRQQWPCYCGCYEMWQTPDGRWLCCDCHPDPRPVPPAPPYKFSYEGVESMIEVYSPENLDKLAERVRLGNDKLAKALSRLIDMDHESEEYKTGMVQWHQANARLREYNYQLKALGFQDCLYLDKITRQRSRLCLEQPNCLVCPSIISYWEAEFEKPKKIEVVDSMSPKLL